MNKEIIIEKMISVVEENNRAGMRKAGFKEEAIEPIIIQMRPELYNVQGKILDELITNKMVFLNQDGIDG